VGGSVSNSTLIPVKAPFSSASTRGRTVLAPVLLLVFLSVAFGQEIHVTKTEVPTLAIPPSARLATSINGEELVYQAEFNKGLLRGVDVGEFRFNARTENISEGPSDPEIWHLTGDVVSKGLFPRLFGFKFHQHVESVAGVEPFAVLRTNKLDQQGKRERVSQATFDHQAHRVTWTERDPNQSLPPRTAQAEFPDPVQDILSVVYFLRTQELEVGKSFDVPVSDSGRVFVINVAVLERKELSTVLGRVNAVRVEPALFGEDSLIRAKGSASIWFTDDDRRIPVKAQVRIEAGTCDIKLKRVSLDAGNKAQ
jgi:hypothetical protein